MNMMINTRCAVQSRRLVHDKPETWDLSIEQILAASRDAKFPQPEIEYEATGLWIRFPFSQEVIGRTSVSAETGEKTPVEMTVETRVKTGEKTREKLLRLVREAPDISTDRLAAELGITRKGVEWQIKQLKAVGVLKRVGPDKGGRWEVIE